MLRNLLASLLVEATVCLLVLSQPAQAGTYIFHADVSVGVHVGNNNAYTPGATCVLTDGNPGTAAESYMLVWFNLSGLSADTEIYSATLRLTRAGNGTLVGDDLPNPYTVTAKAFHEGNTEWYGNADHVTGMYQYYGGEGAGNVAWQGPGTYKTDPVKDAGNVYFNSGSNTWTGTQVEFSLSFSKVRDWISGDLTNNGLRLYSDRTVSPDFYGSGATMPADRPTLILVTIPEPSCLALLCAGTIGLLARWHKTCLPPAPAYLTGRAGRGRQVELTHNT